MRRFAYSDLPKGQEVLRATAVFAIVLGVFVAATYPVLEKIGLRWMDFDEAYSHGLLIFAMAIYLIARAWKTQAPTVGLHFIWLIPLVALTALYTVAGLLFVEVVQQFLLIPILLMVIATISGFQTMWRFLLPVGVLIFAIPFWDYAAWPLQLITVEINEFLLSLWSIEFRVEGVLVFLTGVGAFEIAHGCSGLRYLVVAMSLATIYSELNYRLWRNRIILFVFAVFVALLTNWIRVFVIIYQGYVTDMQSPLINDHDFFGWVLFAVALVPVFVLAGRLERQRPVLAGNKQSGNPGPLSPEASNARVALATVLIVVVLLIPRSVLTEGDRSDVNGHFNVELTEPSGWAPLFQMPNSVWEPSFSGADHVTQRTWFRTEPGELGKMPDLYTTAYVLTYERQYPGKELIHDTNRLVDIRRWVPDGTFVPRIHGQRMAGLTLQNRVTDAEAVVMYGFYVSGHWSSDPVRAKLLQLYSVITGRQDASLVAVSVHCKACDAAEVATERFSDVMAQAERAIDQKFSAGRD